MSTPLLPRVAAPFRQSGFTLVELITVILILGILAAVALPRFADLQGKARESKVKAVAGSLKAAAGIAKSQAMATAVNCATATGTSITLEGRTINLNHCYPEADTTLTDGILGAANFDNDGWTVAMASGSTAGAAGATLELTITAAATPASCIITYQAANSAGGAPTVTAVTSGC